MWNGFDPIVKRELASIRQLVALRHQTPIREWPLVYVEDKEADAGLLVVREWPDGSLTAYAVKPSGK